MHYSGARSHVGEVYAKLQTHVNMSRRMWTSLVTCAPLVQAQKLRFFNTGEGCPIYAN